MSCVSCHSGRQCSCCEQAPSISGHSAPPQQLNIKAQLARSTCHVCSSSINCCCSYGCISQTTPLKSGETNYGGCLCQSSVAHPHPAEHHVCSPSPHSHHHHAHHHHPHQPAVASPLLHSHHCHHQPLQTTPTEHCHAHTAKFHPSLDPSPLCQSISHVSQGGPAICLSKTHLPIDGPPPYYQSTSHPSLEPSPLSRPHPRQQLHLTSASCDVRPHPALREKLFTPESGRSSSSSKLLPPSLEFSPGDSECTPPVSKGFHLGVATEASDVTSSPRKTSSLSKTAKQAPQAPVVDTDNEVAVSRDVRGDAAVPPTGGSVASEPEVKVLDVKSTPRAKAAGGHGSTAKTRSPILLYRWSFKVLPKGMVILLGFKSQDCDELKWRSGPVSERLSSTLLMTRSGQLYHLMGSLSRDEIEKECPGLNQPTIRKFKRGFPSGWQDLLCNQKPLHVADSKDECFKQPATPEPATPKLANEQQEQQQQECEVKKPTISGNHSNGAGAPIKRRIKKEVPDDPLVMLTPLLSDSDVTTPGSGFANSRNVKRSSRGRIIKPARSTVTPYLTNCNDLYTYDWHGNFQGVNSAVIDLTICDDPLPTKKGIKKESDASKSLDHINTSVANGNTTTPTTDALSTTAPAKRRRGHSKKVKVCNEISVQTSEVSVSELNTDHSGSEIRKNDKKIINFSSSDFEVANQSERLEEHKRSKTKKSTTNTVNKSSAVAAVIGSESDSDARHRAREAAPRGGRKREKDEKPSRKKTASSGESASDDGRRERTASGGSRDSDVAQSDHTRQQGRTGNSKGAKKRERSASGGKKVQHTSSAGGKEKGRGVSRVLLNSEGESEGEGNAKNRQRARKNIHSKNRKSYISESETGRDQSKSDAANERGQPTSVVAIRQHPVVDAFSPLLSPAKKMMGWRNGAEETKVMAQVHLGHPRDSNTTQNEPHKKKRERRPSKMAAVRASDAMDAFSPLLSPVEKKSVLLGGGMGEREVRTSTIDGALTEPVDDLMTQSQLRNLRQVVHGVPALTTNFWEVVARQMSTGHTAHQCSTAYHEQSRRSRMKPSSSSSSSHHRQPTGSKEKAKGAPPASSAAATVTTKQKVTKVTGGAGTLKRKRQLRDALEEMDNGYYDDVFESTPFKKFKKSVMIPEREDDNFEGGEDSSLEGEEGNAPKSAGHCYTPSTAQSRVGAPISHTPNLCDYLTTPDLKSGLKRNVADHVIYNAQKAQRQGGGGGGVKKSVSFQKPLQVAGRGGVRKSSSKPCVFEEKLRNIRTGELTTLRMFEDSDDSSSSEDADPFDDILTTLVP